MNVLIIGHACGPGLGSEPGFTWNWAQFLSRTHRIWVIAYPEHREKVEAYMAQHPNENLRFIWVTSNHLFDHWVPEKGDRGIRIHYLCWQREAYKQAAEVCRRESIHLAHHVSFGTVGAPPPFRRLPVPSVWGPIGGAQTTPSQFLPLFGRQRWMEMVRTARVKMLGVSRELRWAARDAKIVFAVNRETADLLKRMGAADVHLLLDGGLPPAAISTSLPPSKQSGGFTLLWAGRLEHRKGLTLGLQALAQLKDRRIRLIVAGDGPLSGELRTQAAQLGIEDRVDFLGRVPYERMQELFRSASAFLFTSVRDSFGSVVLEAMIHGLPIVTLDHQGVGTFVPDAASIKVTVSDPEATIAALSAGIEQLSRSPATLQAMRSAAWEFAVAQAWDRRADRMNEVYAGIRARFKSDITAR